MLTRGDHRRPALGALDPEQLEADARHLRRVRRDRVAADDRDVELVARLRQMAAGAAAVGRLRAATVVRAAREVDVVVARAARRARRIGREGVTLRGIRVAGLAVPDVARKRDVGEVELGLPEADDPIRGASLDAREVLAAVDLVNHLREPDRAARVRIDLRRRLAGREVGDLRRVTRDAQPHVAPRAAMRFERIVTAVAGFRSDDLAPLARVLSGRHEIMDGVRDVLDLEDRRVAVDADPVRGVAVVRGGHRRPEGVPEQAATEVVDGPAAVGRILRRGLDGGDTAVRARLNGRDVRAVLATLGLACGDDEAQVHVLGPKRLPLGARQEEAHGGAIVIADAGVDDRDVQRIGARAGPRWPVVVTPPPPPSHPAKATRTVTAITSDHLR